MGYQVGLPHLVISLFPIMFAYLPPTKERHLWNFVKLHASLFILGYVVALLDRLRDDSDSIFDALNTFFTLAPAQLTQQPWSLFTYFFWWSEVDLFTFFCIILSGYILGRYLYAIMPLRYMAMLYLGGYLCSGLILVLLHSFIPLLYNHPIAVCSPKVISSIFLACWGVLRPNKNVSPFGLFPVRLRYVVLFVSLGSVGTLAFAELGDLGEQVLDIIGLLIGFVFGFFLKKRIDKAPPPKASIKKIIKKIRKNNYDLLTLDEKKRLFEDE